MTGSGALSIHPFTYETNLHVESLDAGQVLLSIQPSAEMNQGQVSGQIRSDVDPGEVASQYVSYISGMTFLWLTNPETFNFETTNAEMKRQLRDSLAATHEDRK